MMSVLMPLMLFAFNCFMVHYTLRVKRTSTATLRRLASVSSWLFGLAALAHFSLLVDAALKASMSRPEIASVLGALGAAVMAGAWRAWRYLPSRSPWVIAVYAAFSLGLLIAQTGAMIYAYTLLPI